MNKKTFLTVVLFCVFVTACSSEKQTTYRIGVLSGAKTFEGIAEGFKAKMTELGYIENKNVSYDLQKFDGDNNKIKMAAEKFVADKVDLILAFPTEPAITAKAACAGTDIPVVFAMAGIENTGLIKNITHPGSNITGVRYPGPEATVKRLEFLSEVVPQAKRIYLIYDRNYPNTKMALEGLRLMAPILRKKLVEDPVNNSKELMSALQKRNAMDDIGIDAILIMPDILNILPDNFKAIVNFADNHNIPVGGGMDFTADQGAIFSFSPENIGQGALAAIIADKIFKGTPADAIMVVTPPLRLKINYKVIEKLGLTIPESMLNKADEIIR